MQDPPPATLSPTEFIESAAPEIQALAASLVRRDHSATAVAAFDWVRDEIRYDPYCAGGDRASHRATAILNARRGYCIQKAVLLAALCRAAGIHARLGFADVINHQIPPALLRAMGTRLFVYHGYVVLDLGRGWIKATPAFDQATSQRAGALLVELDGIGDAMFHPVDPAGQPHMEYIRDRGSFDELPFEQIQAALRATYPDLGRTEHAH